MGRKALTEPTPIHKRMIELSSLNNEQNEKVYTLKEIGEIVSKEIKRKTLFTHEYVRQTLERWNGWEGFTFNPRLKSKETKDRPKILALAFKRGGVTEVMKTLGISKTSAYSEKCATKKKFPKLFK